MTQTKGGLIVEDIKIGDIHYEYEYGFGIKCKVLTKPELNKEGNWQWLSENINTKVKIDYIVSPDYPHYGPNLYGHEAYKGIKYV